MTRLSRQLEKLFASDQASVLIRIDDARGSTPRDCDAAMLVTLERSYGTIGGGELEWRALAAARRMIASGEETCRVVVALGPETGQCCGGRVAMTLQRSNRSALDLLAGLEDEARRINPTIFIFGAGHVGRALASNLARLPFTVKAIDTRPEAQLDWPRGVDLEISAIPETAIEAAPAHSAYLIMTHDHGLDFMLTEAALRRDDAAYVGMIGSRTKRRRFERHALEHGLPDNILRRLTSPIGTNKVSDKRPAVIAALVAAELIVLFDRNSALDRPGAHAHPAISLEPFNKERHNDS